MSDLEKIKYAHKGYVADAQPLNKKIIEAFELHSRSPLTKKTHFFEGRYENIYIDREKVPALEQVFAQATAYAGEILNIAPENLQCGFWFNCMSTGDVTIAHTHDDDDELLSGVYYVSVPDTSARLCLGIGDNSEIVEPEEGMMVFFSPQLVHEVSRNQSPYMRLSIGMNFGLKKALEADE